MCAKKTAQSQETMQSSQFSILTEHDINDIPQKRFVAPSSFSVWIRQLRQGWRQGTVGCKGRSDVSFSNKKPWKQKGTGRARAGSPRSPLWRKGGVIFGPQPRVHTLRVSKNVKQGILNTLLWKFMEQGKVMVINKALDITTPKTSAAYQLLKNSNISNKKLTVFLPIDDMLTYSSFINIPHVNIVFFDEANAYSLANADYWVIFKKDIESFKGMVSKWN